ncbi:MAG: DUF882 domain-containing protein [Myxococcales bacterium]|nr:DUF882 domain-containing protein [Myxococcales bacterium]
MRTSRPARAPLRPVLPALVGLLALAPPAASRAYVTREPELWELGHHGVPEPVAETPPPVFPLVSAAGGPEDLAAPAAGVEDDRPHARNRERAREHLEAWIEAHADELLERRRRPVVQPGELWIGSYGQEPERLFPLDGATTPETVALDPLAEDLVRRLFRHRGSGEEHEMSPRLLALLSEACWFFQARVTLVSGYRPRRYCVRRQSRHMFGAAADVKLDGVPMDVLADFFTLFADGPYGPVGVGRYPRDGFVHVDSRDETYFWTGNQPRRRTPRSRRSR